MSPLRARRLRPGALTDGTPAGLRHPADDRRGRGAVAVHQVAAAPDQRRPTRRRCGRRRPIRRTRRPATGRRRRRGRLGRRPRASRWQRRAGGDASTVATPLARYTLSSAGATLEGAEFSAYRMFGAKARRPGGADPARRPPAGAPGRAGAGHDPARQRFLLGGARRGRRDVPRARGRPGSGPLVHLPQRHRLRARRHRRAGWAGGPGRARSGGPRKRLREHRSGQHRQLPQLRRRRPAQRAAGPGVLEGRAGRDRYARRPVRLGRREVEVLHRRAALCGQHEAGLRRARAGRRAATRAVRHAGADVGDAARRPGRAVPLQPVPGAAGIPAPAEGGPRARQGVAVRLDLQADRDAGRGLDHRAAAVDAPDAVAGLRLGADAVRHRGPSRCSGRSTRRR